MTMLENGQKNITILGSTGTIGINTLAIITQYPEKYNVIGLTAQNNIELLTEQALAVNPCYVAIENDDYYQQLKENLSSTTITVLSGKEGLNEVAALPCDIVISAIVGAAALSPTLAAIRQGTSIGLANKECLVCAGDLMLDEVKKHGSTLLPIDSEHNAIFQCFESAQLNSITGLTLTASGGPFRQLPLGNFSTITPKDAIAHPNWEMGAKISVDSATMVNKGLELIEAYYLFPVSKEQIDIIIHPQSVIHGLVHYDDGSSLASMSNPDMKVPISYALGWPDRVRTTVPRVDLCALQNLTFEAPDHERFPAVKLAQNVLAEGKSAPLIFNAANEIAVEAFLENRLAFVNIITVLEETFAQISSSLLTSLEQVYDIDRQAREIARAVINKAEAA